LNGKITIEYYNEEDQSGLTKTQPVAGSNPELSENSRPGANMSGRTVSRENPADNKLLVN
ncbi:5854_t:CDS:1, partial [Ambispora gerdemannii]